MAKHSSLIVLNVIDKLKQCFRKKGMKKLECFAWYVLCNNLLFVSKYTV
jgi:hypothetical protein